MTKIVQWLIQWLTLGPLRNYRTKVIAVLIGLLYTAKTSGWLDQVMDQKTFEQVVGLLTSVGLITSSVHKP